MENITKALMIAGGILFAILVLTLLVVFFNKMSSYYEEQSNVKSVEQMIEFNSKFENYNGQDIRGNELISVINKVVDYNNTYSDMQGAEKIIININLQGHQKEFLYSGTASKDVLFKKSTITNANGKDDEINKISGMASELVTSTGIDETKLQKLSAEISIICNTSKDEYDIKTRNTKLQTILGYDKNKTFTTSEINKIQNATIKYYQLTQFKRAMFKCTDVFHSQNDGKINKICFEVLIENGLIKFN